MGSPTLPGPEPHQLPRRKLRIKLPLSIVLLIAVAVYTQFILLPQFVSKPSPIAVKLSQFQAKRLHAGLQKCAQFNTPPVQYELPPSASRANPRWNPTSGQKGTIILHNATLFDGERFIPSMDIEVSKGVVVSVAASSTRSAPNEATILSLEGKYVTPGLIDMHSHHLGMAWPLLPPIDDVNEIHPDFGPLTPFVRSRDGMKGYDLATAIIASGGITSSLILPGSANIMGGEAFMVKNILNSGPAGEERIEDLLLEQGIPTENRRRYMKMACGENPKRVYKHNRMGNAWVFRHHMERARELKEKQDEWCLAAAVANEQADETAILKFMKTMGGGLPEQLELDSSVAMLRGQVGINVHCYEPEDFEDMLLHSKEFNFRIQAFHHALSAWKVPEMIKESGENITIATFASHGLYKHEAYEANLWAGKILSDHGVPLAYKSDHSAQSMNAQFLLYQAATAHSFHVPEDLALQSVTSVPAKSLGMDHRIGYVRPGYDADIVVFDSHPLSIGATPLQVFIDGRATLDNEKVKESLSKVVPVKPHDQPKPQMRAKLDPDAREETCKKIVGGKTIITGITESYLQDDHTASSGNLTLVLDKGKTVCFDTAENCLSHASGGFTIALQNGHVLPGLTAAVTTAGMVEIEMEAKTGDGTLNSKLNTLDPENVVYAKYGVHLDGRAFERARIGGVTRVISAPLNSGFLGGVSVGVETGGEKTILDGGVFRDEVALHFTLGQGSKHTESTPTISSAVAQLRKILSENSGKNNIYGRASNGSFPLVVHAENKDAILQLIKVKESFPSINLIIYGAAEAASVASALSSSRIPIILTPRPAPESFEKRSVLSGPPLTPSPASVLHSAGVFLALGSPGDAELFSLPLEASWAAKHAGLSWQAALALVSVNLEKILGLPKSEDVVVWEGNPLQFGASVVLVLDKAGGVKEARCWPESQ